MKINLNSTKHISELTNEEIRELQTALSKLGYKLSIDGIYGEETKRVFTEFKKDNKLSYPELIGVTTINFLKNALKPKEKREINQAGLDLIKEFEGFRSKAYLCPASVWTIGYGNTFWENGQRVKSGQTITREKAEELLKIIVQSFADVVSNSVKVPINDNQFASLVSLAFNIGIGAFRNSTLLRVLNQRNYTETANQFLRWNRAGGKVLAGLTRRRQRERQLFLTN